MESHDVIGAIVIVSMAAITGLNLVLNGDGVAIGAFSALTGIVLGYVFGERQNAKQNASA